MTEFFASSLISGYMQSSGMGRCIVAAQLLCSVWMVTVIIGKFIELRGLMRATRRVTRDVMGSQSVLDHCLNRRENGHSPIENIYWRACDRLLKQLTPDVRSLLMGRQPGVSAALTKHEMGLVKSIAEHVLDEEWIRVEKGMGMISTVVTLAPMLGLLGTVWGVLDAFAEMGAAGSANLATIAPSISAALVTTVVGLLVAIPGVIFHSRISASIRHITSDMEGFADELIGRIACEFQGRGA